MSTTTSNSNTTGTTPTMASLDIRNTTINTAPGVTLSDSQRVLVGSVLDLFTGHPTLKKLSLWHPQALFADPLSKAQGHAKYAAQWYGLAALFRPIAIQSHSVTRVDAAPTSTSTASADGVPPAKDLIEMSLVNRYTIKGINSSHDISSTVRVFVGADGRIVQLEDVWKGSLPEGVISQAFRKLNAATVPLLVTVPKTEEEDMKMQRGREVQK